MPRKSRTDQELGWLRNVWEELAGIELLHQGRCTIQMVPGASRSVFVVNLQFTRPAVKNGFPEFNYTTQVRYPNGDATQLLPWLWGRCQRFADEVALADLGIPAHQEYKS